jgi:hypothetical protein
LMLQEVIPQLPPPLAVEGDYDLVEE